MACRAFYAFFSHVKTDTVFTMAMPRHTLMVLKARSSDMPQN